jgi:hypothetical protein
MRKFWIAAVGLGWLVWLPQAAGASCAELPRLAQSVASADVIFVGRVTAVTNGSRWATVAIEDVWKGRDLPAAVEVHAGPADPPGPLQAASSVDRTYRVGSRYIFFPYGKPPTFRDSSCSATQRYEKRLEGFRPASAPGPPDGEAPTEDAEPTPFVPLLLAALVAGAVAWVATKRVRRKPTH